MSCNLGFNGVEFALDRKKTESCSKSATAIIHAKSADDLFQPDPIDWRLSFANNF